MSRLLLSIFKLSIHNNIRGVWSNHLFLIVTGQIYKQFTCFDCLKYKHQESKNRCLEFKYGNICLIYFPDVKIVLSTPTNLLKYNP